MEIILNLGILLFGSILLGISSTWLVNIMNAFTKLLGLRSFVVAAVMMAISTSLPELFVGIESALNKESILSFGNIIGSNIADITLVLGIAALVGRGIRVEHKQPLTQVFSMWILSLCPVVLFIFDRNLSRADGIVLILFFALYIWQLQRSGKESKQFDQALSHKKKKLIKEVIIFLIGIAVLFIGARLVVVAALNIAAIIQLSPVLIGLFLLGIGTSLPELVFQSKAARTGNGEFALGDALGSVACNSTLVIGLTALIYPFSDNSTAVLTSVIIMPVIVLALVILIVTRKQIRVIDAIIMILSYSAYAIFELFLRGF